MESEKVTERPCQPGGRPGGRPTGRISDRLSSGAVWIVAARVYMIAALMIHTVVLARLLSPELFGLAAIATTVAAVVEMATKQSLTAALVQLPKVTRDHIDTAFTLNLIRGAIIGGTILLLAHPIASFYDDERIAPLLMALGISTSLFGISNPKIYEFTRDLVFWQEFARTVAERTAVIVVSVAIAYYYRSPWAIIAGVAAGQISLVVSSFFFKPYRPRLCMKKVRDLLSFSIWVTLSQFQQAIIQRMDQLLVGYLLGNASLGILTVSTRLAAAPTKETSMPLLRTAFPGFAKLYPDMDKLRGAYQRVQSLVFLLSFPVAYGLLMVAEPTVMLFLGEKWAGGVIVVQMLAGAFGLQAMASAVNSLAMAMGETRILFFRTMFNTTLRLAMVVTGLLTGGLMGLLIAQLLHSITVVFVNMNLVRRFLGLSFLAQIAANSRTIIATIAMVAVLFGYDQIDTVGTTTFTLVVELAAKVVIGGLTFLLVLGGLWKISDKPGPEDEFLRVARQTLDRFAGKSKRQAAPEAP